jgi:phosphoribosylcarboxyaminoimidazole (NCAIR) mutase
MTNSTTDVAIIMGSDSDLPIVELVLLFWTLLALTTQKT